LIGIEPEIVERAEANRVGGLVLRKCFCIPSDRACVLRNIPRYAAIALAPWDIVICPTRLLWRRVKSDVTEVSSGTQRHAKGLNAAIEILVKQRVLIVPDSRSGIGHFIAHKPDTIISRVRLLPVYRRPCPSRDGRVHSHGLINRGKAEARCTENKELMVGSVVIHVALPWMGLTPLVLLPRVVLRFREIGCALIERCVEITDINANPVRCVVMGGVAGVVRWIWIR